MKLAEKIINGERAAIAKAITLVESSKPDDRIESRKLISQLIDNPGKSIRVGFSGPPGVGKTSLLKFLSGIYNAGSIFSGSLSPESFGDYSSGSNHVLPTNGMAKVFSGLGVKDFGKQINVQTASSEGFLNLKDTVITLANAESLDAHARAVEIREKLAVTKSRSRISSEIRKTNETSIYINLNLDGTGQYNIDTGLKYLDHLLEQFSKHGSIDLNISCLGDLEIDEHHTIEDIAITLLSLIHI